MRPERLNVVSRSQGTDADCQVDRNDKSETDPPGAVIPILPITARHADDFNLAALTRRVNEALLAEIDADMGKRPAQCIEEHQVARFQLISPDLLPDPADFLRVAWQGEAKRVGEDIMHQSAAIKSGFRRTAPVLVRNANQP